MNEREYGRYIEDITKYKIYLIVYRHMACEELQSAEGDQSLIRRLMPLGRASARLRAHVRGRAHVSGRPSCPHVAPRSIGCAGRMRGESGMRRMAARPQEAGSAK
jgi:hypothetical protein